MSPSSQLNDILGHGGIPEIQERPEKFKDLREEMRELSKSNLYFLGKAIMGWKDMTPRIHWPMCQFAQNPPGKFTLLMSFRGSLKSTIATVGKNIQLQLQGPTKSLIYSEGSLQAEGWSRDAREAFEGNHRVMCWLWPELQSNGKAAKWGDSYWKLPHGGTVQAAGTGGELMGTHVNSLFMDDVFSDPHHNKTPEYAERALTFIKMSLPLLVNPAKDQRYLIGVPWWTQGEPYAYYRKTLPKECQFYLPFELPDGSFSWPERIPPEEVDTLRRDPFVYASQYLLNPVSQETAVFKADVIKTYREAPQDRNFVRCAALDPSFSEKRRGHHSALVVGDRDRKGNLWIEHALKIKAESHEVQRWTLETCVKLKVRYLAVECNGAQLSFLQGLRQLMQKFPLHHPVRSIVIVEIRPTTDKVARWNQLSSGLGSGQVRIHERCSQLMTEMCRVTGAKHEENDLTDAAAHLVGPELSKFRPFTFSDLRPDSGLPYPLQEDEPETPSLGYMAS